MYSEKERAYDKIKSLQLENAQLRKELRLARIEASKYLSNWIAAQDLAYHRQLLLLLEKAPSAADQQSDDRQIDS